MYLVLFSGVLNSGSYYYQKGKERPFGVDLVLVILFP